MSYERIIAEKISPGDSVARTRTAKFCTVEDVRVAGGCIWITYEGGARARPRLTAKWWRVVEGG
jgi:hypothetical protein